MLGCLLVVHLVPIPAEAADAPSLTISQLKITSANGQFITLYNASNTALDMSRYQLEYFNNYDLSKATSSKLIALSGTLPPHGYLMVNDGSLLLCYQLTIDSVSLGLSSTAGMLEVLAFDQNGPGAAASPVLQDYVGWSKTAAPGAQTLPTSTNAFLQRQPADSAGNPTVVGAPGAGSWLSVQPDAAEPCRLVTSGSNGGAPIPTGLSQLLPPAEPPLTSMELAPGANITSSPTPVLPAADIGLIAPTLNELLPNPNGTGNDSSDEFIELYNANATAFDLSGFGLQSGTTSLHVFTFPAGTNLPPHAFTTFYSKVTGLSLSNSGGQVKLLDPFGNSLSASAVYGSAGDGQAWALGKGKWYWTTSPTPGKANVIHQPAAKKTSAKSKTGSKSKTTAKTSSSKRTATGQPANNSSADEPAMNPIHLRTLALVGSAALLYGAYEYRTDLANRIHQLRQYLGDRYANRT